ECCGAPGSANNRREDRHRAIRARLFDIQFIGAQQQNKKMKPLGLGILGSGKGSNCRAILECIRSGALPAEARVVIADVLDAPILEIAREFHVPNAYLPPGQFRTRFEPQTEMELVQMLRDASVEL